MARKLSLYPRGDTWWVTGTFDGVRVRESTGQTDKTKAQSWATKRQLELDHQSIFGPASVYTFGAAMNLYLQTERDERFLWPIFEAFDRRLLKDIHPGDVIDLANRLYPNASGATKNRQVITPVVAVFRHAAERGKCQPIIVKRFETKKVLVRKTATWAWVAKLAKVAKPKIVALILFLPSTAARISDALKLEWKDVDLKTGTAFLRDTKNGEDRLVKLLPEALDALKVIHRPKSKGPVFQFYDRSDVRRQLQTACKAAGIDYIPTHGIGRRLFATSMNQRGINPKTAAKAGGWKTARMYMEIYAQADDTEQAVDDAIGTELSQALKPKRKKARQTKEK